jgi:SAM-dependent methyltransferase
MSSFRMLISRTLHSVSQRRWSGDEPAAGLTWGRLMTGESLWALYRKHHKFTMTDRIFEIGPGYGRLLRTALDHKIPFASYTALELSEARVGRLQLEYQLENVHFVQGDIDNWSSNTRFDVVICSATFEHLYPDCRKGLSATYRHLDPKGHAFIDFVGGRDRFLRKRLRFFSPNGTYVRIYPRDELFNLFAESGFDVKMIETCALGLGKGGWVDRLVVVAQKA